MQQFECLRVHLLRLLAAASIALIEPDIEVHIERNAAAGVLRHDALDRHLDVAPAAPEVRRSDAQHCRRFGAIDVREANHIASGRPAGQAEGYGAGDAWV